MVEIIRRQIIAMLLDRGLSKVDLAENLLSWRGSGFSIDNSVRIFNDQAWERLLVKVQEIDPLLCPNCGPEMKTIAVIRESAEIRRILAHPGLMAEQHAKRATRLAKIGGGRPPCAAGL